MSNLRICLIDDEPIYALTIRKMLQWIDTEIRFFTYPDGKQAIDFFLNEPDLKSIPHIILLDINMPVMNGWEFMEHWQRLPTKMTSGIHLYIVSSSIDSSDMEKALGYADILEYKIKPIRREALEKIIANFSGSKLSIAI